VPRGEQLHLMQYNLLADRLAHPHRYAYVPLDILSFSYRSARILEEIRTSDCDVLCLQEMDHAQDVYLPALDKMGYKTLYYQKKPVNNVQKEGLAISFKSEILELVASECIDMNEVGNRRGAHWGKCN